MKTDVWRGRVIENLRKEHHVSLAIDLDTTAIAALELGHGDLLEARAQGHAQRVFFHGWMKVWSMYRRFFGEDAAQALKKDPGADAYIETDRTLGGTSVPGHAEWVRLRLAIGHEGPEPAIFSVPAGTELELAVVKRADSPLPVPSPKLKKTALHGAVLASHPRALTLNVAFPALRKLKGTLDDWYTLDIGGTQRRIHNARGIGIADYEQFYAQPDALLFDFQPHWADEETMVMVLRPMQTNWPGRFPDFESATQPFVVPAGTPAILTR